MKYIAPECSKSSFTCPHCGVLTQQGNWGYNDDGQGPFHNNDGSFIIGVSKCTDCQKLTIWRFKEMVYPFRGDAPIPNPDMPEDAKKDYEEAASIFTKSPRGASALLRLGIQKLCQHLGGSGENTNQDIKKLVQGGLPKKVQQALDSVRVIGNHSVHPGQIDTDNPKVAASLFTLVNLITDYMISKPKEVEAIYESLPDKDKENIQKRDKLQGE